MRKYIAKLLLFNRKKDLCELENDYFYNKDFKKISSLQLYRFNCIWKKAYEYIPFYSDWKIKYKLPSEINHIDEIDNFPILTKNIISEYKHIIYQTPNIERSTLTGGTSGISTSFPMNKFDSKSAWLNTTLGRKWNGIYSGDKLLMIWGHSHLFGNKDIFRKKLKRKLKDFFLNIERVSAYDLNDNKLEKIYLRVLKFKPNYIIGYGSCLGHFAKFLRKENLNLRNLGVKKIINTSETISTADKIIIEESFNCPIINEYGMAEAGVIGYSVDSLLPIKIFWKDFIIRIPKERILITTIGERCFPLINYDSEDIGLENNDNPLIIKSLIGKARDIFKIKDKNGKYCEVSVVLFDHIFKQILQIKSIHYQITKDDFINIYYSTFGGPLDKNYLKEFFIKGLSLENIFINPKFVRFIFIKNPLQTLSGKRLKIKN